MKLPPGEYHLKTSVVISQYWFRYSEVPNNSLCLLIYFRFLPIYTHSIWVYSIVLFRKSQCALRYLDPMSKIQNTSSQCSLVTWLTVTANEQNDDWPAPVSLVSVQPVIGWLKDGVARYWSHIVHRPRPHGNLPLPCIVRNGVWYCVKYSSLK